MTTSKINLIQVPNQTISFNVAEHSFDLNLRTTDVGLFANLSIDGEQLFYGRRCVNEMPLILSKNLIKGNFYFYDINGNDDPIYTGFNDRFVLLYDDEYII